MEDLFDPEEKILCPYNNAHHIRRCKMSFHLVKCKKNYGEQKMVRCDFNVTHMIPEPELQYHHQMCPDRKKLEAPIIESLNRSQRQKFPMPNLTVASEENWDDLDCPTYDPKKYTESNDVIRHLDVASSATRKNFRLGERQRLSELNRQKNVEPKPETNGGNVPPHGTTTNNPGGSRFNPTMLKEKLKVGQHKVFMQYDQKPN